MDYNENEWKSIYHDENAAQQAAGNGNTATATDEPVTHFEKDPVTGKITFKKMMGDTVTDEVTVSQESLTAPAEQQERAALKPSAGVVNDAQVFIGLFGDLDEIVAEPIKLDIGNGATFECYVEQLSAREAGKLANAAWRGPGGKMYQDANKIAELGAILNVQRCVVRLVPKNGKEVTEPIFSREQVTLMYDKAKTRPFFEALYSEVMRVNGAAIPLNLKTPQESD